MRRNLCVVVGAVVLLGACIEPGVGPVQVDDESDAGVVVTTGDAGADCLHSASGCRLTLHARWEVDDGARLSDGALSDVIRDGITPIPESVDISASIGRYLVLSGSGPDLVCVVGQGFASLADVPVDESGCSWVGNVMFGVLTNPYDGAQGIGRGLLLRDRSHSATYKARVVLDDVSYVGPDGGEPEYLGTLTLDYARVRP